MTETPKAKRITKAQRYADIKALLSGEAVAYDTTIEDAVAFIDKEVELLAKKNSGEKGLTDKQKENEKHKERIIEYLATQTEGVTCTTIQKSVADFADYNNQKIANLANQLVKAGKVNKAVVKGKSLFSLA